jgi:hypothetical protein
MAVQLNIVLTGGAGTVIVPIPAGLQSLDSGQQASQQTGFSAVDSLIRSIFKSGVFTDTKGNWYPTSQISSITAS